MGGLNNIMPKKFLNLVENMIARHSNGGLLVGDVVKFANNYKSKDSFKALSDPQKKYIEDFLKTDKNLRVVDITTTATTRAPNDEANRGTHFNVVIATELAPGLLDLNNKFTVPSDVLETDNTYPSLPSIANSYKKKEKRNLKPTKPEENEEVAANPYSQTLMSQDGDKLVRGDRALLNKNVKIPSQPATKSPAVQGGYTHIYLPTTVAK